MNRTPRPLLLIVFVSGMSGLAIELTAARLIGNYFGSSLPIWAAIIGLTLLYLTIGYTIGGRLADRYPRADYLYQLTGLAGLLTAAIPFLAHPVLQYASVGIRTLSMGVFAGAFIGVLVLLSAPLILLGCVSPWAIRLSTRAVESSGNTAGLLYALSTLGSIVGTFLPVLLLIPSIGTRNTFIVLAMCQIGSSAIGLMVIGRRRAWAYALLLLLVALVGFAAPRGVIRAAEAGVVLYETESAYNYIQVVESDGTRYLVLNEGQAVHSVYNPDDILTRGPWDYFMVAPFFNLDYAVSEVKSVAIVGLGAGTSARQLTRVFGQIPIDGVEIDPAIVRAGRKYFDMTSPNINAIVQDGRYFMRSSAGSYDIVAVDAYRQPYIPAQLTTREFFTEVYDRLTTRGAVMLNAGRTATDTRLVDVLASTMKSVFPSVFIIEIPYQEGRTLRNSMIVATKQSTTIANFRANVATLTDPLLRDVAESAIAGGISEVTRSTIVFTDDKAPVEQIVDQIILDYALGR